MSIEVERIILRVMRKEDLTVLTLSNNVEGKSIARNIPTT